MGASHDFRDLLQCLNGASVRYMVVGAHAVAYHTEPRYTKDLDVWVEPSEENAARLWKALAQFGAPLKGVTVADFTNPELVYQIGVEPVRIDVMMDVEGVSFETAWRNRIRSEYRNEQMYVLGRNDLIRAKRAAGRPQDELDVKRLLAGTRRAKSARRKKPKRKRK
jgi:hypothetical protein